MSFTEIMRRKEAERRERTAVFFRVKRTLRKGKASGLPLLTAAELLRQREQSRQGVLFTG